MSIVSLLFPFFIVFIVGLYFIVPKRFQWLVILLGNFIFYIFAGIKSLIVILATSVFVFLCGLLLQKKNDLNNKEIENIEDSNLKKEINNRYKTSKNIICTISIVIIIGLWLLLKLGTNYNEELFFIPLGISFYSLNAISYLIDINRKKYDAERNILKFITFMMYFPHIIQGPFSRYNVLSKQLFEEHSFSYDRLTSGSSRILFGFFKKLVIADKLALIVNNGLNNYSSLSGYALLLTTIIYSFQLYADFSGYMDIICGISHIFGIESEENFRQPYFSKSIDEFWRRWHISLGLWFKDYLFYPISMNKTVQKVSKYFRNNVSKKMGKLIGAYIALIFVWTATGLWHNFTLNYLVWGYLNMLCIISSMQLEDFYKNIKNKLNISEDNKLFNCFRIVRTFILVCLIRVFSITSSLGMAVDFIKRIFIFEHNDLNILFNEIPVSQIIIGVIGIIVIIVIDVLNEKQIWDDTKNKCPMPIRNLIYALLIVCLFLFAGTSDLLKGFMYARF